MWLLMLFILVTLQPVQENEWRVVEACAGDAVNPPAAWTFEGAVLMTGQYGIHAISRQFATPYVVAFVDNALRGDVNAGLSPDGRWYAVLRGFRDEQSGQSSVYNVFELRVYNTLDTGGDYVFPLEQGVEYGSNPRTRAYMRWLDNDRIIYTDDADVIYAREIEAAVFDVSTGTVAPWSVVVDPLANRSDLFAAPDWTRALVDASENVFDPAVWELRDVATGERLAEPEIAPFTEPVWSPDGSMFVAEAQSSNADEFVLALFDRNGNRSETLLALAPGERMLTTFNAGERHLRWSADGRRLAFVTTTLSYPNTITLYIADVETRTVVDTCIWTEAGIAFSPDGTQIALFPRLVYDPRREMLIYDVETGALYRSGRYHAGSVIGWRAN